MLEVFFVTGASVVGIAFPIMTVFILQHYVFQHLLEENFHSFPCILSYADNFAEHGVH